MSELTTFDRDKLPAILRRVALNRHDISQAEADMLDRLAAALPTGGGVDYPVLFTVIAHPDGEALRHVEGMHLTPDGKMIACHGMSFERTTYGYRIRTRTDKRYTPVLRDLPERFRSAPDPNYGVTFRADTPTPEASRE